MSGERWSVLPDIDRQPWRHCHRCDQGRQVRRAHCGPALRSWRARRPGVHQQADGMTGDGPGALATGAVRGRSSRWYSLLRTPTQQTFDATHLHIQRATPYKCFAVVSGSKFDGAVSVDNDCIELVRTSIVEAAQEQLL